MKSIGATAYRFSIAWPRIFPEGTGQPNPKGLDFYQRLVDALLEAGIAPFATLYHWDLPQALQDRYGGWQSKDAVKAFADYAGYVAEQLSDRVGHFFTINEFRSFVDTGHRGVEADIGGGKTFHVSVAPRPAPPPGALVPEGRPAGVVPLPPLDALRGPGRGRPRVGFPGTLGPPLPP